MTYNSALLGLIEERVRASQQVHTAMGTLSARLSGTNRVSVTFDGSSIAVPVKILGHVPAYPDDRVALQRFGGDWIVVGAFASSGDRLIGEISSTSVSAAIGTTETAVLTIPQVTFQAGGAYRVEVEGGVRGSAAGNLLYGRLRNATVSGTLIGEFYRLRTEGSAVISQEQRMLLGNTGASDITIDLVYAIFLNVGSGTVEQYADTNRTRRMAVYYIGPASRYTNLKQV